MTDQSEGTTGEIGEEIRRLAGDIAAATARFLVLLAEFDRRGGWTGVGIRSCAHWLSWKCGMSLRTARDHVRVAGRLPDLPATRRAFTEGRLSYSKARALTRVATAETEADLLDAALHCTAAQLDRLVAGVRALPDPDDDDPAGPDPHRLRLSHRWDHDTGDLIVHARLAAEEGGTFLAALKRAEIERTRTAGDEAPADPAGPPPANGRAALLAMAQTMLAAAEAPDFSPSAEVSFVVDERGAHVDGGAALGDAAAATVVCSPAGRRVDASGGRVLRFGRRRRAPSAAQLRALRLRDGACRHPACGRTRFLHAHHVRHWSRGGRTDLDNLILLCGGCHRALHEGAFAVRALGGQRFVFGGPEGERLEAAPAAGGAPERIREPNVTAATITGDWDGEPLHVHYAVSVLAQAWERDRPGSAAA